MPRKLHALLAVAATLVTGGCNWYYYDTPSIDAIWYQVPWFDHMIAQRSVHPYSRADIPRYTVAGTVPITGGERDWRVGDPLMTQYGFDSMVAKRLPNPTDRVADARGDTLYHTFCAVCHGVDGNSADATVGPKLAAPSLLTDRARSYADGYLYSMIRYGRGIMPQYGDKITRPADRWAIVNYVRSLQAATPAVTTGATTGGTR
ncbi:MAG TPA: cytochrome c [Gemmatimonadales bacterium]|nr:cytochrome c [Gemmatimonadales bacterium]